MEQVLLLNASYEPHSVISWQRAIELWFRDKIEVIKEYADFVIKSVTFSMNCPAVIRLKKYIKTKKTFRRFKFNRLNVYSRDKWQCQYCLKQFSPTNFKMLTYDHVIPRSKWDKPGSPTIWSNILTACRPCNQKKADRTPEEAGMIPFSNPGYPNMSKQYQLEIKRSIPKEWEDFLLDGI